MAEGDAPFSEGETRSVRVDLGPRSYRIVLGAGTLSELGERLVELPVGRRAFLVVDSGLPKGLVETASAALEAAGFAVTRSTINALESNKTVDTASRLLHEIAETRHERRDPVIALGGGITGDIAGYVGATFKRGVPVVQCPTTLLAMVDASVGGKTGVNLLTRSGMKKNLVGAFWQPSLVLIDVVSLESLSERLVRSGLAECLKHSLICESTPGHSGEPGAFFRWTSENMLRLRMGDASLFLDLIERNVRIKASVVAGDEREEAPSGDGGRALLNLGHTFAHAIETIPHLTPDGDPEHAPLQHGEAVALGLVAAGAAAHALGELSAQDAESIRVAVERMGMESRVMALPPDAKILEAMAHDKKVVGGKLRLVLPTSLGRSRVVDDPPESCVRAGIDAIRAWQPGR